MYIYFITMNFNVYIYVCIHTLLKTCNTSLRHSPVSRLPLSIVCLTGLTYQLTRYIP